MKDKVTSQSSRILAKFLGGIAVGSFGFSVFAATITVPDIASMPTTGGEGTIRYTGESGTVSANLALTPAANKAATVAVDSGKTLTFTNKLSAQAGAFIKTGGGTLELQYPGTFSLGQTYAVTNTTANNYEKALTFTDGNANQGFASLTVADGTLKLNGGANQKITDLSHIFIGANYPWTTNPVLQIIGGNYTGKAAYIDPGASTASRGCANPRLEISGGAQVSLTDLQVCRQRRR